jgi:protein gp37
MITRAIDELEPDSLCGIGQHNHSPVTQWPWPNVWIGATICNQEEAERDIPKLLKVSAAKRFLSIEPLLGKIDISRWLDPTGITCMDVCPDTPYVDKDSAEVFVATDGEVIPLCPHCGIEASWAGYDNGIDWVIVGGESGPGARPMHPKWALDLRDQCIRNRVPFLFKQWGEWAIDRVFSGGDLGGDMRRGIVQHVRYARECDGHFLRGDVHMRRVGKKKAGRVLDGQTWDEVPS